MVALLAFLVGGASIVEPVAGLAEGEGRGRRVHRSLAVGLTVLVALVGCVLAVRPLHVGVPGAVMSLLLPPAWVVWEMRLDRCWSARRKAMSVVVRWGLALTVLMIARLSQEPTPHSAGAMAVAWIGVLLLMTESANRLVSAVLVLAGVPGEGSGDSAQWSGDQAGDRTAPALRGGHWIGALERLLLILLAVNGAEIPAAVIIAAKGVVRFPEISQPGGRAAEVFLIGSLTSWTLAVLGVLFLRAL